MKTISLCMIVKNEEAQLARCLSSVRGIADEILITDTGSTDATKEIARQFTDKVFDFPWEDDFSKARNASFAHASMEYILWLDADDVLLEDDRKKLKALKESLDGTVDAVMMQYHTGFDAAGNVTFRYYRERLVKRARHFVWKEPVHEYLEVYGKVIQSAIAVTHQKLKSAVPGRNLAIYERILAEGGALSPRGLYYYARELKDSRQYEKSAHFFEQFFDGGKGWVEDQITACESLAVCYAQMGQREKQLQALTRSFVYDTPRAELCCALGYAWKAAGDYQKAAFWFRLALTLQKPKNCWGFLREDCWGYIPCMELTVCYDQLGMPDTAEQCNELAAQFKPDDAAVQYNRTYFRARKQAQADDSTAVQKA